MLLFENISVVNKLYRVEILLFLLHLFGDRFHRKKHTISYYIGQIFRDWQLCIRSALAKCSLNSIFKLPLVHLN